MRGRIDSQRQTRLFRGELFFPLSSRFCLCFTLSRHRALFLSSDQSPLHQPLNPSGGPREPHLTLLSSQIPLRPPRTPHLPLPLPTRHRHLLPSRSLLLRNRHSSPCCHRHRSAFDGCERAESSAVLYLCCADGAQPREGDGRFAARDVYGGGLGGFVGVGGAVDWFLRGGDATRLTR